MNEPITLIRSRAVHLAQPNIDTDQIIPARFLTTSTRDGLGEHAFADWRVQQPNCPLDAPEAAECGIILAGHNFGCGSSREHAAWALGGIGVKAVLSTRIADIFTSNALKNGIVPATITEAAYDALSAEAWPEVEVDVEACEVRHRGRTLCEFPIEPFARRCLLEGVDQLGFLLGQEEAIAAYETART
ncbi:MAG: 3-isopropylmalate dehydratase small subunit [Planctomycetota bacterium]